MIKEDEVGLVWFRNDLRLHDQEALLEACSRVDKVVLLYNFDDNLFKGKTSLGFDLIGGHRRKFLEDAVLHLKKNLDEKYDAELIVKKGCSADVIFNLVKKFDIKWVFCNRERTPIEVTIQDEVEQRLWTIGREMRYSRGKMLLYTSDLPFPITHVPESFGAFKKEVDPLVTIRKPLPEPLEIRTVRTNEPSDDIGLTEDDLLFSGGELNALAKCEDYIASKVAVKPGLKKLKYSVLQMSPYVSSGCISPKYIMDRLNENERTHSKKMIAHIKKLLLYRDHCRLLVKKNGLEKYEVLGDQGVSKDAFLDFLKTLEKLKDIETPIKEIRACGFTDYHNRSILAHHILKTDKKYYAPASQWFASMLIDYDPCSNYVNWYKQYRSLDTD